MGASESEGAAPLADGTGTRSTLDEYAGEGDAYVGAAESTTETEGTESLGDGTGSKSTLDDAAAAGGHAYVGTEPASEGAAGSRSTLDDDAADGGDVYTGRVGPEPSDGPATITVSTPMVVAAAGWVYAGTLAGEPDWPYGGRDGSGVRMGELAGMRMGAVMLAVTFRRGSVELTLTDVPFWGMGNGAVELIAELLLRTNEITAGAELRVAAGVV